MSEALGIPYVIAEASYAQKRADGPGRSDTKPRPTRSAVRLVIAPSRDDLAGLEEVVPKARLVYLPPFLDMTPYQAAARERAAHRAELAKSHGLDAAAPWIVVAAMMRAGDKLASYRALGAALSELHDVQ